MNRTLESVVREVEKVIVGKRDVICKILMAVLAGGHVLLDDVPGVGKTTLAVALGRSMGLQYRRVQFTPDVLPSDIVGFSAYDRGTNALRYVPGAAIGANLLLGDEINRTSSKTQSALLEAMEEGHVTVDGTVHQLEDPFCVIATQNRVGTAGTQPLPHAQMDRFLMQLTVGYPDYQSQMELIRDRQLGDPMDAVSQACSLDEVRAMRREAMAVTMKDILIDYITRLAMASREDPALLLGISPRGALSVSRAAKARAYLEGRDYALPEDVGAVFCDVCAHRVIPARQDRLEQRDGRQAMEALLSSVKLPHALA